MLNRVRAGCLSRGWEGSDGKGAKDLKPFWEVWYRGARLKLAVSVIRVIMWVAAAESLLVLEVRGS